MMNRTDFVAPSESTRSNLWFSPSASDMEASPLFVMLTISGDTPVTCTVSLNSTVSRPSASSRTAETTVGLSSSASSATSAAVCAVDAATV